MFFFLFYIFEAVSSKVFIYHKYNNQNYFPYQEVTIFYWEFSKFKSVLQ